MSPLRERAYAMIERLPDEKLETLLTVLEELHESTQPKKRYSLFDYLREGVEDRPEMTLEEINEEIRLARIDMENRPAGESLFDQMRKNSPNGSWMTMDEIDEEIRIARAERAERELAAKQNGTANSLK